MRNFVCVLKLLLCYILPALASRKSTYRTNYVSQLPMSVMNNHVAKETRISPKKQNQFDYFVYVKSILP